MLHTRRSKPTQDLPLPLLVRFCPGMLLGLRYGRWIPAVPGLVTNGFTLLLALSLLGLKLTYRG